MGWLIPYALSKRYTDEKIAEIELGGGGTQGPPGSNGVSSYLWIRYSQNADGSDMTTTATNAKYLGVAVTTTNTAPTNYSTYQWSLIKGSDGGGGGAVDLSTHETSAAPHQYGNAVEWRYNPTTNSLDLVWLP